MNAINDIQAGEIQAGKGLTRALAEQARTLRFEDISAEARLWARQCVLDAIGCTIAGASDALVDILLAEMREQGGAERATVIGHAGKLPAPSAAIVNGAASHALDFDDVNLAMPGHPSVAILPALLALAEERGASGAAVLTAFVAGYELQCRVGKVVAPGHYDGLGFHATATIGSFGAAAACAHLMGLDAETFATALGIAGTQAAGLKSMFGTMCKPLHAGKASYHGYMAAKLAARGFTSRTDVLECGQGFARTHSPDFNPDRAFDAPPNGWYVCNNLFKYHASCYMTHAPIEAARKLREQHGIVPAEIEAIEVQVEEACDRICNIPQPRTGLEAKFSLRLTTAMGLAGVDTSRLATYSEAVAADPELVGLRDKVSFDFRTGIPNTFSAITLRMRNGSAVSAEHDSGKPATDAVAQGKRLEQKFAALVDPVLGADKAARLIVEIGRLETLPDLRGLMALCGA
ncbi:MmgE/PrpD family protein [Rhodopila sp.]|jgi:2-methylcitrate dehydratase PrpD|uniref:MmgE/PrpD family protein n=1 Tax=Rhodopila sp. TaxID=2480087 RepID=UPI002D05B19E|nr:MmgE/PrpD family protein [Rhodopila sp.]HVZ07803.1 MmgE/PrpD family protein [Rhodopila sp.]